MRVPRFRLRTIMIVVALAAIGMALARWDWGFGAVYGVLVLGAPVIVEPRAGDGAPRLRRDAKRAGLSYLAGVVGPTFCLIFDPFVFRGGLYGGRGTLQDVFRPFFYGFMGLEMFLMTAWLVARPSSPRLCALVAGAFGLGALYALGVGLVLLPLSVIGLMFGIGIFGFIPFFTAHAYYRQARLALDAAGPIRGWSLVELVLLGVALVVVPPALAQVVLVPLSAY